MNQAKTTIFPSRVIMMFLAFAISYIRPTTANFEFTGVERNFAIGIENADDDDFILSRNGGGFFPKNLNRCRTISEFETQRYSNELYFLVSNDLFLFPIVSLQLI